MKSFGWKALAWLLRTILRLPRSTDAAFGDVMGLFIP